jgi:hypothetical protein
LDDAVEAHEFANGESHVLSTFPVVETHRQCHDLVVTRIALPLSERQAARIEPLGLLADDPAGLLDAWENVEAFWHGTVDDAVGRKREMLGERVNGEWSFLETLRHLIFVTDAWIGDVVLERTSAYDPIGLPPDFITNGAELGLDLDARPSVERVLAGRERGMTLVRQTISALQVEDLDRRCAPRDGQFCVLGAIQVVIFEEWAHHVYAVRDLAGKNSEC